MANICSNKHNIKKSPAHSELRKKMETVQYRKSVNKNAEWELYYGC